MLLVLSVGEGNGMGVGGGTLKDQIRLQQLPRESTLLKISPGTSQLQGQ